MNRMPRKFASSPVSPVYLIDHGRCTKILGSTRPAHAENALLHAAQTTVRRCPGIYRTEHGDTGPLLVDLAPGFHADGVVVKPFSDPLWFDTCVVMRANDDSKLVNEFAHSSAFATRSEEH